MECGSDGTSERCLAAPQVARKKDPVTRTE